MIYLIITEHNGLYCWCVFNLRSVGCRCRLVPCFARAGHIYVAKIASVTTARTENVQRRGIKDIHDGSGNLNAFTPILEEKKQTKKKNHTHKKNTIYPSVAYASKV